MNTENEPKPNYRVSVYDGSMHPAPHPYRTAYCATEGEARRVAAGMLGKRNLRGASTWGDCKGGTVYQFGPRSEDSEYDYAVIEEGA